MILTDTGSVRNLIDKTVYLKLPFQSPFRDFGDGRVIGVNGKALDLSRFSVIQVTVGMTLLWYNFGFVPNLPLEVFIGAAVLAVHQYSLL